MAIIDRESEIRMMLEDGIEKAKDEVLEEKIHFTPDDETFAIDETLEIRRQIGNIAEIVNKVIDRHNNKTEDKEEMVKKLTTMYEQILERKNEIIMTKDKEIDRLKSIINKINFSSRI
jgi:hypothetical protein